MLKILDHECETLLAQTGWQVLVKSLGDKKNRSTAVTCVIVINMMEDESFFFFVFFVQTCLYFITLLSF